MTYIVEVNGEDVMSSSSVSSAFVSAILNKELFPDEDVVVRLVNIGG